MFCKKCGKQIDDDSKFCIYCGTKLFDNDSAEDFDSGKHNYSYAAQTAEANSFSDSPAADEPEKAPQRKSFKDYYDPERDGPFIASSVIAERYNERKLDRLEEKKQKWEQMDPELREKKNKRAHRRKIFFGILIAAIFIFWIFTRIKALG